MNLLSFIYTTLLFIVCSSGIIYKQPILVHVTLFVIIMFLTYDVVDVTTMEGNENEQITIKLSGIGNIMKQLTSDSDTDNAVSPEIAVSENDAKIANSNIKIPSAPTPSPNDARLVRTQSDIYTAVNAWIANPTTAETTYGHIKDWDTSGVTSMYLLFSGKDTFNDDISGWDVSNVTNMQSMFWNAKVFNQSIGNWNVSNVTNLNGIFATSLAFNQPIGNWNVSKVTDMENMFYNAYTFNQPIGNWDVSNVTNMKRMFSGSKSFNQPISNWDVSNVTDMGFMFYGATIMLKNQGASVTPTKSYFNTPTKPGCYIYSESGCPNNKGFNTHWRDTPAVPFKANEWAIDMWGMKNANTGLSEENCKKREPQYNSWCNVSDFKTHFNPRQDDTTATPVTTPPVNKGSVLQTSKILTAGQKLTSSGTNPNTKKSAFMQSDGNFVIYDDSNDKPLWSTGSGGKGTSFMIMQPDGNLVVYKGSGPSDNKGATWATMTNGTGTDNYLSLEEGGLKIYKRAGGKNVEVWSSSTSRGITIK